MKIEFQFLMRLKSTLNMREHWAARHRRHKAQREEAYWSLYQALQKHRVSRQELLQKDITITLTRIAPRMMDTDNLAGAFKAVRDGLADTLKQDDGASNLTWVYRQEKGKVKEYVVVISLELEE